MAVILTAFMVDHIPKQYLPPALKSLDFSREARLKPEHAAQLWPLLNSSEWFLQPQKSTCSDDVVAADQWGNIASLCHTSNCLCWGKTALMVDGISIHDPAMLQQASVAAAGPGGYVKSPLEVGLILKDGVAEIGFASKNMGLHQKTVGMVASILEFGMSLEDAAKAPEFCLPRPDTKNPAPVTRVVEGDYSPEFLAKTGVKVEVLTKADAWMGEGHCIGVSRHPATELLTAVSPRGASGQAAALNSVE
jgi:gamma-glutamyltranspeptidase/glutathione hydrolase